MGLSLLSMGSGSDGNSTYVTDGVTGVLIDVGLAGKKLWEGLKEGGEPRLRGIFLTHEHMDHVGGLLTFMRALLVDGERPIVYGTAGTIGVVRNRFPWHEIRMEEIGAGGSVRVGGLTVHAVPVPHDVMDPVAYRVEGCRRSVGVFTDFGKPTWLIAEEIRKCEVLLLEANHDVERLMGSTRPMVLKRRIRGSHGHLSNVQAGELLRMARLCGGVRWQDVLLGHLSKETNEPGLAVAAVAPHLEGVRVHIARHLAKSPILTTG